MRGSKITGLIAGIALVVVGGCSLIKANPSLPATIAGEAAKIVTSAFLTQAKGNTAFVAEIAQLNQDIANGHPDVVLNVFNDPNGPLAKSGGQLYGMIWTGLSDSLPTILALFGVQTGDVATYYGIEQSVTVAIVQGIAAGLKLPTPVPGEITPPAAAKRKIA